MSARHAAVLVPLFEDPATRRTHVVLTQRAAGLRSHGGEVCFPGGKREEGDADDVATAVREAQEELGLDPNSVRVLGCLGPVLSKHLLSVTPVLATIPARHAFHPNPDEVQAVFAPPLHTFLEASDLHSSREATFAPGMPYRCALCKGFSLWPGACREDWTLGKSTLCRAQRREDGQGPPWVQDQPCVGLATGGDQDVVGVAARVLRPALTWPVAVALALRVDPALHGPLVDPHPFPPPLPGCTSSTTRQPTGSGTASGA